MSLSWEARAWKWKEKQQVLPLCHLQPLLLQLLMSILFLHLPMSLPLSLSLALLRRLRLQLPVLPQERPPA